MLGKYKEKASSSNDVVRIDNARDNKPTVDDVNVDEEYSFAEQRKIVHRVDLRLVTICGAANWISGMDRTNTSMAAIAGMNVELDLDIGSRYSLIILVFFITSIIFQPFATACIRRIGPRLFITFLVVSWGVILIGAGFVKDWAQMVGIRALLGAMEAGFFPGAVYLLSCWYSRYELQTRYSLFYLIGAAAGSLSGILAFGLSQLDGRHNLGGWRWIFILEGVISIAVGILCWIFIVDFPDRAYKEWGFLTEQECAFVLRRLNRDRGDADPEPFSLGKFLKPALNLKIWGFAMIMCCLTTVTYAIAYFLPIILTDGMGFGVGESQCLVAPPYILAVILMSATSWFGDKYRTRSTVITFIALLTLVGVTVMGFAKGNAVRYFGVFLTTAGANANIPACMAYQANNIRGQWTRAFASASLVGMGSVGGIAGSTVFRQQDAPEYVPGIWAAITSQLIIIVIVGVMSLYFWWCNRKADRGEMVIEGSERFRYTI